MQSILNYNHIEARKFFLKEESYKNFEIPKYFAFTDLIQNLSQLMKDKGLKKFYKNINPDDGNPMKPFPSHMEDVNYRLLSNKDGKYAWRPLELIHPAIYVALVNDITKKQNWELIINKLHEFQINPKIECHSIPLESDDELTDTATLVKNWWRKIEQKSIKLSIQYEYIFHTDISNCYCSIYTHSVPWALHTKRFAKKNRSLKHIGNMVDRYLRDMAYGQTNGIPQGSKLMDFISEIILGYADSQLSEKLQDSQIEDYYILRYRDDYRIFGNNPQTIKKITKILTEILIELGLQLNIDKTMLSKNVIRDSIKPDKLYWNSQKRFARSLQNQLLIIHNLSERYPNSGSLRKSLDSFFKRLNSTEEIKEDVHVLISILVDIAYRNPRTYPVICGILSKFFSLIGNKRKKFEILKQIKTRFKKIPNTGYLEIWLQRVTLKIDRKIEYNEKLCKRLNDSTIELWNSNWLNEEINDVINNTILIDENIISEIDKVVDYNEIKLFEY